MLPTDAVGLDVGFLAGVAQNPSAYQRMKLARELAAFVSDDKTGAEERSAVLPVLLKLANDEVVAVRRAIAQEMELGTHVPPELAFAIAADEDGIALPFLTVCPGLSSGTLVAIARVGDAERLIAIAKRTVVPRAVLGILIKQGTAAVCTHLLANHTIKIPIEGFRILLKRFGGLTVICEAMRKRKDLPVEVRIQLTRINNDRVKVVLARQGWVPDGRLDDLVTEAEEISFLQIASELDSAGLEAMVRYLATDKLMTGSLICRAACHGEISFLVEALAFLASMPSRHLATTFATRNVASLKSACERAELPTPCISLVTLAMQCGKGYSREEGPVDFAQAMVNRATQQRGRRNQAGFTDLLSLIGAFGPEEIKPVTDRLREGKSRAA